MLNFLQRFRNQAMRHDEVDSDWSALGLPLENVETDQQIARYGSYGKLIVRLAWEQFNEGKLDDAINNTSVLIEDTNLQHNANYVLVLGAAYYVRGLAYEEKEDRRNARANFQAALKLIPNYEFARRAFARVQN